MAALSSAESYYSGGDMKRAVVFAMRARKGLTEGTPDWERANDIIGVAAPQRGGRTR